jgi:hypothetical protein
METLCKTRRCGIFPSSELLRMLADLEDEPYTAAFRWGLMISDLLKMEFQLLSLPETSESESFQYSCFKLWV